MDFLKRITCPHCWHQFPPEKILWISEHNDLLGDPLLGDESQQRFLPTRFTVTGEARDARGFPCHQLACPKCHLSIPRALLELEPLFFSIFGAPASGKSYFLAAMTWELRKILPLSFHLSFSDADPLLNQSLNEYEDSLFSNSDSDELVPLANLIRKTEEQGEMYDLVSYGTQTVSYPRPFLMKMQPQQGHPNESQSLKYGKTICLYDNAGESFQPGKDSVNNPVTRHMAMSRSLFFVFDPTQDARFRRACKQQDGELDSPKIRGMRQEPILQEAASRIRRYSGLRESEKHSRPLIVILTKCDSWLHLLNEETERPPWRHSSKQIRESEDLASLMQALDYQVVADRSRRARDLLLKICPEIVTASESFAEKVFFIPVSAIGWETELDPESGMVSIRPADADPYWVTVPFIFALATTIPGLVPMISQSRSSSQGSKKRKMK